jgi:hypothetical protein
LPGESPEVLSGFKEDIVLLAEERFAMILDLLAQKALGHRAGAV